MPIDFFQMNLEEKISLPLLVRDWALKNYPKKCCISIREYFDKEINFTTNQETSTLAQLMIMTNTKLNSAPGRAYCIYIDTKEVVASYEDTEEWGKPTKWEIHNTGRIVWLQRVDMDWRAPDFFEKLKKAIGCQCKKVAKKQRRSKRLGSRTS